MPNYTRSKKDGTNEIPMFSNWEPYRGNRAASVNKERRAISTDYFTYTGDDDGDPTKDYGYLLYNEEITVGAIPEESVSEGVNWLTQNDEPFVGCRRGSVVKGQKQLELWAKDGEYYLQYSPDKKCLCYGTSPDDINTKAIDQDLWRVGIVIVGTGGTCGNDETKKYDCSSSEWKMKWPGGGGGGGAIVWAVLNIKDEIKTNDGYKMRYPKFKVVVPKGPTTDGTDGFNATVTVISEKFSDGAENSVDEEILVAEGGKKGQNGNDSTCGGGRGGFGSGGLDSSSYHTRVDYKDGQKGGGYWATIAGDDSTGGGGGIEGRTIYIKFLDDNLYRDTVQTAAKGPAGNKDEFKEAKGKAWLAVPGGSSWGQGGWINGTPGSEETATKNRFIKPGIGGGGVGCANYRSGVDPWGEWNYGGDAYCALYY